VPDLAAIISCAVQAADPDMDLLMEDVTPLYCLLAEMLQYAANLPQLAAEWDTATAQQQQQQHADNPYLKLGVVGSPAVNATAAPEQSEDSVLALLPPQAFSSLMDDQLFKGLAYPSCAQHPNVLLLAGLLSWNNGKVSEAVLRAGATSLWKLLNLNELHHTKAWDVAARNLSLMMLQPDSHLIERIVFWLTGQLRRLHNHADTPKPIFPGLASFQTPVCWHTVAFFRLVQLLLQHCRENPAGPPNLADVRLQVGHWISSPVLNMQALGLHVYQYLNNKDEFKDGAPYVLNGLLEVQEAAKALQQQQQQPLAAQQAGSSQPVPSQQQLEDADVE